MESNDIIIIDNKIVTEQISYCRYNSLKSVWDIKYRNNNVFYHYKKDRVKVIKTSNNALDYMKKVSLFSAQDLKDKNGKNILSSRVNKIEISGIDTALANYLQLSSDLIRGDNSELLIFPFGCNSSQYKAVENAINGKISVIEGPPGTGKTQTILNIIANIIIRDMNCQVVSNNNDAIKNIKDKLKKYDLDFILALLGKTKNKDLFVVNQMSEIPNLEEFKNVDIDMIIRSLREKKNIVQRVYNTKKEIARLLQYKNDLLLEYKYFEEFVKNQNMNLINVQFLSTDKLNTLFNEIISLTKISFWHAIKFKFYYKVGSLSFYKNDFCIILNSIKNAIYLNDIKSVEDKINENQKFVDDNEKNEEYFINLSMLYFRNFLYKKYLQKRRVYTAKEIWKNSYYFLKDYPVVLSTTYSSRNNVNDNIKFDYIIMDEASQIDVVTGTLALSSAKYAVIIGDEKQLPNVIKNSVKELDNVIFKKYTINKGYSFSLNSFLSSVKNVVPDVCITLLKEHYRCHPKIINYCNKKFYNNELIIMTKDNGEKDVIKVIKTVIGNHARGKTNQRQSDIIMEIMKDLKDKDCGIIAPYNDQVDLINKNLPNVEVRTVHKFQGREKDVIIISTVDDVFSEFAANPTLLNVAISRAKEQLIFIVTGNEIKNRNIQDFIDYVDYNNMEIVNSKVYSVFDILYKQNEEKRFEFFMKHHRKLKHDSENIVYYLLKDIVSKYNDIDFLFYQPLNEIINDKSLLTEKEKNYVSHHNTHIDFRIYNTTTKKTILLIEVDGYKYHHEGTEQYQRDLMKNSILKKYNIPFIRLATNGSREKEKIMSMLDDILR